MSTEFKLPELGENIEGGDIVGLLVSEGDEIKADQEVLELETDKAVVPVPCPYAGKVQAIRVKAGDYIKIGDVVLTVEAASSGAEAPPEKAGDAESSEKANPAADPITADAAAPGPENGGDESLPAAVEVAAQAEITPPAAVPEVSVAARSSRIPVPAAPATRRLARELGVAIDRVSGSGPGGRITRENVKAFVKQEMTNGARSSSNGALQAAPLPDFSQWGEIETKPLSGIRKVTAEAMRLASSIVAPVTQFDQANITKIEAARKRYDKVRPEGQAKVTVTAVSLKAVVAALKKFPQFNASIDMNRGEIIYKNYYHIGIAVDTEHGLMVPVIRNVDKKTVSELAGEMADLADRARRRRIDLSDLKGGTFTITNLGGIGGTAFTPIVNYPEVAILGMARAKQEPVLQGGKLRNQLQLPLCLTYDHRLIDGADGARFLRYLAQLLEEPFRLILDI